MTAHADLSPTLQLAIDLIRRPSVTPIDADCQKQMMQRLGDAGFTLEPMRIEDVDNFWATHGNNDGPVLCFAGHTDVVPTGPVEQWGSDPFVPTVRDGKLYGRGAADMKAGIVAYTQAFRALQKLGYEPAAPVYLQSVVEEECTGNGALACLVEGYTADAAIIPEPFEGVMSAQMGVMWLTIDVHGLPVHASVAHTGELFVIISYTGRTRELVEVARLARENGASVLGLTAAGSPLAKASTLSLNIPLPEDTDIYMPMTSRIIQLTVLDVLATGMTLRRGVDFQPHLRKIKESLNASRYPVGDEFN